jgi:prepilin-type N-terminal cleavage/methylation domain-containing protein
MSMKHSASHGVRGFTLIEAMIATAIIGVGVAALFVSLRAGTEVNSASGDLTQAVFLANEIRERTLQLPFSDPDEGDAAKPPGPDESDPHTFADDLDDLMDVTLSPPQDASGAPMNDLQGWSQTIKMTWRDPQDLATQVADGASDVIRVDVTIQRNGKVLTAMNWLVTRR